MREMFFIIIFYFMADFMAGCAVDSFDMSEKRLIGKDPHLTMRVLTIDDKKDSVLLRSKSKELSFKSLESDYLEVLRDRMLLTVKDSINDGVGIAAPQVGVLKRLIAVQRFDKEGEPFEFYANPTIIKYGSEKIEATEGCLSIPETSGKVERSNKITVSYTEPESLERRMEDVEGFTAIIFQHEVDHLDGVLFTDKIIRE